MKRILWLGVACATLLVAGSAPGDGMRTVACYGVPPTSEAPVIDGRLDDACWQTAAATVAYYVYWKPDPGRGELKTRLRMVYDARGIYLAIENIETNLPGIRARMTARDSASLWQDDCAEIYFDPAGASVGYTRFVVNPLGTQGDSKRVDAAVMLPDWNGTAWMARTAKRDDAWIIEASFPWSDLGAAARPGDLWRFNHVRYAYSTGKFVGVTWSPGGNYMSPQNFGYLHFLPEPVDDPKVSGKLLGERVSPPWQFPVGKGFLICRRKGSTEWLEASALLEGAEKDYVAVFARAETVLSQLKNNEDTELKKKLAALVEGGGLPSAADITPLQATDAVRKLDAARRRADDIYWQGRILQLMQNL